MSTIASTHDEHMFHSVKDSSGGNASLVEPTGQLRWMTTLVVGLLLAVCSGAVVMYFYTPRYETSAVLKINGARPFIAFAPRETDNESQRYIQSQIELIQSPVVLAPLLVRNEVAYLEEIKGQADPIKYLQKRLSVEQLGKSELYLVSYTSPSAQDAATVANAIVAEYLVTEDNEDRSRSQLMIQILEKERLQRATKVELLRKRVVQVSKELTGLDPFNPDVGVDVAKDPQLPGRLLNRLSEIDLNCSVLEAEIADLSLHEDTLEKNEDASRDHDAQVATVPEIESFQATIDENNSLVDELKQKDTKWRDNSLYVQLDDAAEHLRAAFDKLEQEVSVRLSREQRDRREQDLAQSIAKMKSKLAGLKTKKRILQTRYEEATKPLKSESKSTELEFARAELDREKKVLELITSRKMALQTEMRAPARVSLVQTAKVPSATVETGPFKQLALACSAALLAPIAIAFIGRRPTHTT